MRAPPGGATTSPRAVRKENRRKQGIRRTEHVHPSAGQHVRGYPDHLRFVGAALSLYPGEPFLGSGRRVHQAGLFADQFHLYDLLRVVDRVLLVFLHGGRVQPLRPVQQHEEIWRFHPGNSSRKADDGLHREGHEPDHPGRRLRSCRHRAHTDFHVRRDEDQHVLFRRDGRSHRGGRSSRHSCIILCRVLDLLSLVSKGLFCYQHQLQWHLV